MGLKPVKKKKSSTKTEGGTGWNNEDGESPKRETFGVLNGMAYVIYADGSVDVGADGKAVSIPPELFKRIAKDYNEYIEYDE